MSVLAAAGNIGYTVHTKIQSTKKSKHYLTYIAINELSITVNYKKHKAKDVHKLLITCVFVCDFIIMHIFRVGGRVLESRRLCCTECQPRMT
jgi:hypothetical protein